MEPNTPIYGLNEFKVTYPKILQIFDIFSIIKFQGLVDYCRKLAVRGLSLVFMFYVYCS